MNDSGIKYYVKLLGWSDEQTSSLGPTPQKITVFLIGPPGSGKGTQADLLAERFGLTHIQTSKLGEAKINDPEAVKNDPEVAEAKRLYDAGELFPPPWTVKLVLEKIGELAGLGKGVILSGSPRTLFEAEKELPEVEKLYGRNGIKIININIDEEESIKRNSHRRVCKANGHPIPNFDQFDSLQKCPQDGSEIVTRSLDTPDTIKTRNEVYRKRTEPVLAFFRERGYNVIEINGEQPIDKVFQDILREMGLNI